MEKRKKHLGQKAQGIVEYILLLAAVIALLIVLFRAGGPIPQSFQKVIEQQGDDMLNAAKTIF